MTDLVQQSDTREARERAGRIRLGITSYLSTLADISSAWDRRDWATLGYADWDSYLDGEFSEVRLRVPAEHRTKAITELRMAGMSTRAIAATVNLSQATVAKDVRQLSEKTQLAQPQRVRGLDGRERPAVQQKPTRSVPPAPTKQPESEQKSRSVANSAPEESSLALEAPTVAEPPASERVEPPVPPAPTASVGPVSEEDAVRRSRMFIEDLVGLFVALDPSPVSWLERNWRPVPFSSRDLPRARDAFTSDGLRTLGDHLHTLAGHLDQNGISL